MLYKIEMNLYDIFNSIDQINEYLGVDLKFSAYEKNKQLRRAVERESEIIGGATNRIVSINPNLDISNAGGLVNLRNQIIHAYDNEDYMIIWAIINEYLPLFKGQVIKLLNKKKL